jgi:hypothetical protein
MLSEEINNNFEGQSRGWASASRGDEADEGSKGLEKFDCY